jgi:hypothetical protein
MVLWFQVLSFDEQAVSPLIERLRAKWSDIAAGGATLRKFMPARERRSAVPASKAVRSGRLQIIGSFPVAGGAPCHTLGTGAGLACNLSGSVPSADGHAPAGRMPGATTLRSLPSALTGQPLAEAIPS